MKHTIIIHIEYNGMQFLIAVPRFGITVHALINNCKVYQSRLNLNSKLQLYPPPPENELKNPIYYKHNVLTIEHVFKKERSH